MNEALELRLKNFNNYATLANGMIGFFRMKKDHYFLDRKSHEEFVAGNQDSFEHTKALLCEMVKAYRRVLETNQSDPDDNFSEIQSAMKKNYAFIKEEFKDLYLLD